MMDKYFKIISDSTCDLSDEIRQEYDIGYIPGHAILPDGREVSARLDWSVYGSYAQNGADTFYDELMKKPDAFKTSPCNVQEIYEALLGYAKEGTGVLMTCISSGMSGTYAFACEARKQVLEEVPDAEIRIVDSRRFSICNGLMCVYASLMRREGKSLDEIADYLEEKRLCFRQMGWHDNLSFVAKKGRINHSTAFMGKLVGIKTLGECSSTGMTTVIGKVKGTPKAYRAVLEYIDKTIVDASQQVILIGHTARPELAEELKRRICERFSPRKVYICDVFPSCGINIGPGLIAAYYLGTQVSEELTEEKALINNIIASL